MTTTEHKKDRNLSRTEYLEMLQIEYLVAEVRKKIYTSMKDKAYWNKTMLFKKQKILGLTTRNELPSIFSDERIMDEFVKKVYTSPYPNFHYSNKIIEENPTIKDKDLFKYYSQGEEFRLVETSETGILMFVDVPLNKGTFYSKLNNTSIEVELNQIVRIL